MAEGKTVEGYQIELDGGRHVFVAETPEKFMIQFCSEDGKLTRLALSKEAGDALRHLLGKQVPADETIKKFLVHMTSAVKRQQERMVWQEVTLPAS